jgi:glycolate oxidase iron-sulfur subunit
MHAPTLDASLPPSPGAKPLYLKDLDFGVLAQCIHCGLCLPTCPTYDATKLERHSPRGRIQLMRNVAEGRLDVTEVFGNEMYFCLGCLACETACPAGVDYTRMFEEARADIERTGILNTEKRSLIRGALLRGVFTRPWLLRLIGRLMRIYQASGLETLVRKLGLMRLAPKSLRELEPLAPRIRREFSDELIAELEMPKGPQRARVGMLTGCVQDLTYSHVNRDTVDVLLANGCEVLTPRSQHCCGSLHGHNGEVEVAREMARRNIDAMERTAGGSLKELDAIITNAGGCGTHLKHYDHLLHHDPRYAERARLWTARVKDVHEFLAKLGLVPPPHSLAKDGQSLEVTYHESCHLCHGQKITKQPRELLRQIPGVKLVEMPESSWCCGSAGVYNITQPEMSMKLLERKMGNIAKTGAKCVANGNPGCSVQLEAGVRMRGSNTEITHPMTLLARAYRGDTAGNS